MENQKINILQNKLVVFLIGIIVGAVAMGFLQAYRPIPFFSKAAPGGAVDECLENSGYYELQRQRDLILKNSPDLPPDSPIWEMIDRWEAQMGAIYASCTILD